MIFILRGTGIFLVLFYIYPIVPYASALCAQFLKIGIIAKNLEYFLLTYAGIHRLKAPD